MEHSYTYLMVAAIIIVAVGIFAINKVFDGCDDPQRYNKMLDMIGGSSWEYKKPPGYCDFFGI